MTMIARINDQLRKAVYGDAWHGPSVMRALEGITAKKAIARPVKSALSIWEITLHLTNLFRIRVNQFRGENAPILQTLDRPDIPDDSDEAWSRVIEDLKRAHKDYQHAIDDTSDSELFVEISDDGQDLYTLYQSMIQHCLYHAGQIMILRKSFS